MEDRPVHQSNYTSADRDSDDGGWYVIHLAKATDEEPIEIFENPERSVASTGTAGVVLDGPVDSAGTRWYEIEYDDGRTGWSDGDALG